MTLKACLCGDLIDVTDTTHTCEHTYRKPWDHGGRTSTDRGYGHAWRKRRAAHLRRHPHCARCGHPATTVDHIIPKAEGGADHSLNLQSLCQAHAAEKDKHDRERGQARAREKRGN